MVLYRRLEDVREISNNCSVRWTTDALLNAFIGPIRLSAELAHQIAIRPTSTARRCKALNLSRAFGALQFLHCFHDARACTRKNPLATQKALDRMLR